MTAMTGRRGPAPTKASGNDPLRYIETSALLAAVLERDEEAREALRLDGLRIASVLTFVEADRVIVRAAKLGRLTPSGQRTATRALRAFERRCAIVSITDEILARARRPFPVEPVRTLDAIHLATAESLGEPPILLTVVTRDARVARTARALGYSVG